SKVLAYFPHDYVNTTLSPVRLSDDLATARQRSPGLTEMMDLYGIGDHGGGPTRAMLDEGFRWAVPSAAAISANGGEPVTAKYQFGTAQSFFSTVEKQIAAESPVWNYQSMPKYEAPPAVDGKVSIPTWDSELYLEYHRGVYTTQAMHKKNMRVSEEEVLNAEKWSSLAWLDGAKYPGDELTEDWKKVLFNQFHDLAAGSGIGVIYKDAQKDYDWVRMSTNEISAGALADVSASIDTRGKGVPVVLYNPLGWDRSGEFRVRLQFGQPAQRGDVSVYDLYEKGAAHAHLEPTPTEVPDAKVDDKTGIADLTLEADDVPAFGYKVLWVHLDDKDASPGITPFGSENNDALETENIDLSVSVDKVTGCIRSVFDRLRRIESIAPNACGNQLQFFKDTPKDYDAWNIDPGTLDVLPMTIEKVDSVEPAGTDAIRVTSHWQNSKFVQTIRLVGDQVDVENDIDWHEKHVLLKAAFPLAVKSDFATYEIPYGAIERPTTRNNSWEKAQFEVPAMRWADLSGAGPDGKIHGLSLLNQDKYGYDAVGNVLRLTLLRSPTWPDPDADQGHHHFHYALYPHAGT